MKLKLTPTKDSQDNLNSFVEMVENFTQDNHEEIFDLAFQVYSSKVEDTFNREGPGWDRLASWTLRERADLGFSSGPILQRTGVLKRTLTDPQLGRLQYSLGGFSTGNEITKSISGGRATLRFGTLDPRFEKHQMGGQTDDGFDVPPRPMVPEDSEQNQVLSEIDTVMGNLWEPPKPRGWR